MLYYRTKKEANNKPMYRGKGRKANEEAWSIYIADELFTEKEVTKLNLNMDYLEPVEIQKNQTHRQGCYRVANFDANISKAAVVYKPHLSVDSSTRPTTVLVRFKVPTPKKSGKKRSNPGEQAAQG